MFCLFVCLFVVFTGELLTQLFLWLFKWLSKLIICTNLCSVFKIEMALSVNGWSTRTKVESETWDVSLGCVGFWTPPSSHPPAKAIFLQPLLALMYGSWEFLFAVARSHTLNAQFWHSGLWLLMLPHKQWDFNSEKPSFS